jgi:hypothetical protein
MQGQVATSNLDSHERWGLLKDGGYMTHIPLISLKALFAVSEQASFHLVIILHSLVPGFHNAARLGVSDLLASDLKHLSRRPCIGHAQPA